jgi:REP element-mobilizing transposase RayT
MPDHVHAIFRLIGSRVLHEVLKAVKGRTAHPINEISQRQGRVWTQETFDHIVRDDADWAEKIEYIRQNPVRKGLVRSAQDYRWLYVRK